MGEGPYGEINFFLEFHLRSVDFNSAVGGNSTERSKPCRRDEKHLPNKVDPLGSVAAREEAKPRDVAHLRKGDPPGSISHRMSTTFWRHFEELTREGEEERKSVKVMPP